jgi:putative ABC transport system permease protein
MILLRLVSWPYVRRHALRTLLTVAGIVLGVAVLVGMNTANRSVLAAFASTVDRIAGKTELQVTAGEAGFPEDVLENVQSAASVRVAVPVIEVVSDTKVRGEGSLLVLGVDLTGDRGLRDYELQSGEDAVIDDPLVFLAQPDSIIVSSAFADRNGLATGSVVALGTVDGDRRFTIRGLMEPRGLASAFGGNLAVMDIYAAQKMFGRGRTFDRIDIALHEGRSIDDGTREIQELLGSGFRVETPASRGGHFESMIAGYSVMMSASSVFALFIGMFIVYNAFATAVTERRSEIGILRALGATRGQIQRLFLAESAVAGLAGAIGGVAVGVLAARGIAASVAALLGGVFGVAADGSEVAISPVALGGAVAIGVLASMIAALVPARSAAGVEPVLALRKGSYQTLSQSENRLRAAAAAALGAAAIAALVAGARGPMFYASHLLALLSAFLLTPVLAAGLTRALRPLLRWVRPVEGALAADNLLYATRRTSATLAALMFSVALVVAFAGMARATYGSLLEWVDSALNPELFVMPAPDIVVRTMRFPAAMTDELRSVPGVATVQPVREARVGFMGSEVMLVAVDLESIRKTSMVKVVAGNERTLFEDAAGARGLIVSDSLAQLRRLQVGDVVEIPSPSGMLRLPIVGTVVDYSDQQGTILMERSLFARSWSDDSVNFFRVYLTAGTAADDVKRRVLERYGGRRQVFVLNNDELRTYILDVAAQWFSLTYIQVAIAVLVAVLGIVNMLTVSITDRRRELAVLRAVGGMKRQIRQTIWIEAMTIGAVGVALGCAVGAINLYYALEIVRQDVAGMRLVYQFPVVAALALVPLMLAAALVAALWPAASAVRQPLVEALEYE